MSVNLAPSMSLFSHKYFTVIGHSKWKESMLQGRYELETTQKSQHPHFWQRSQNYTVGQMKASSTNGGEITWYPYVKECWYFMRIFSQNATV